MGGEEVRREGGEEVRREGGEEGRGRTQGRREGGKGGKERRKGGEERRGGEEGMRGGKELMNSLWNEQGDLKECLSDWVVTVAIGEEINLAKAR